MEEKIEEAEEDGEEAEVGTQELYSIPGDTNNIYTFIPMLSQLLISPCVLTC